MIITDTADRKINRQRTDRYGGQTDNANRKRRRTETDAAERQVRRTCRCDGQVPSSDWSEMVKISFCVRKIKLFYTRRLYHDIMLAYEEHHKIIEKRCTSHDTFRKTIRPTR